MAPAPNPGPTATVAARGIAAIGIWRLLAVAMPHLGALVILLRTETDTGRITLLDRRIITKRYGKAILNSLPPFTQVVHR